MSKKITVILLVLLCIFCLLPTSSFASYVSNYSEPYINLKRGTYGTGVKWLQDMLAHNGYFLNIDGEFGNITYNCVVDFQKKFNLQVDGIVGSATKSELKKNADSNISTKFATTRLNFRVGPSTSYSIIQVLEANSKVDLLKEYNSEWSYIKYNNKYGYVCSKYLSSYNSNTLPLFNRNETSLLSIIQNCKSYLANNSFYYSTASGVRTIPADKSVPYSGKYYIDCSSFVTWVLYEYASANGNNEMKNYFSYQRNSATFASIGNNNGNGYITVVDKKGNTNVNLNLAKPGDILVSNGHVEFFNSYVAYSPTYINIKVYNCGSNSSINNSGVTTSATLNSNDILYILRVK